MAARSVRIKRAGRVFGRMATRLFLLQRRRYVSSHTREWQLSNCFCQKLLQAPPTSVRYASTLTDCCKPIRNAENLGRCVWATPSNWPRAIWWANSVWAARSWWFLRRPSILSFVWRMGNAFWWVNGWGWCAAKARNGGKCVKFKRGADEKNCAVAKLSGSINGTNVIIFLRNLS